MKPILIFLLLCPFFLSAQPAPNFTVTDSNGNDHQLYEDYLNQGKTVVLKFFFTFCPPCNANAPQMIPFYEQWGAGNGDLEMISLSIMPGDSNDDVASYKNMHNHDWPGVGNDGGALDAAQVYLDGTWGPFFGTPTFAVIAANGSVLFNPKGNSFAATLDSLDAAILSTGARKAISNIEIKGTIHGINDTRVADQIIGIANEADSLALSDNNGEFLFTDTLHIFNQQELTVQIADTVRSAVSVLDVILAQRHILSIDTLTAPYQLLAADVNRSGDVSAADLIEMLRYIRTQTSILDDQTPWLFLPSNYEFANPDLPALEIFDGELPPIPFTPADETPISIIGIRIGDVDGSANQ